MQPLPPHANDLGAVRDAAFAMLAAGAANRRVACHTPSLATIGPDGAPRVRTLVLRGFDAAAREARLHTDVRSGKVAELRQEPRAELHAYDSGARVQLRLRGRAALHAEDALAEEAWAGTRDFSRAIYGAEPAPGVPVAAPPEAPREGRRENFAVILLRFEALEWLWLAAAGHRRALFTWQDGREAATWLAP